MSGGTTCRTSPNTDGRRHGEAGQVALFLALATPVSVFVVLAGEFATGSLHRTRGAQQSGLRFASGSGLWALGPRGEEQRGSTFTRRMFLPHLTRYYLGGE
jgi:hypothetical protein